MTAKEIHVNPMIPFFLLWTVICLAGGIMLKGAFLTPPLPDLRAEYCRGLADGDQARYQIVYNVFDDAAAGFAEDGLVGGLVVYNPETQQYGQIIPVTGPQGWLTPPDAALLEPKEASCVEATDQALLDAGLRGPSDMVPPTTTTVPPQGGGAGLELDR